MSKRIITNDNWKKNLVRGDIISIPIPNDFDKNGNQKYRPAIVLENKFNDKYPIQTLVVQTLTCLSNWSKENKENKMQNNFYWNGKTQYIQAVGFIKISYGLVENFYRYKQQRLDDCHKAMKLIKTMYDINDDWSNLNPTGVLLSSDEERKIEEFEKQLLQEFELRQKNDELKGRSLEQQQKINDLERRSLEQQQKIIDLERRSLEQQQRIIDLERRSLEQQQKINEGLIKLSNQIYQGFNLTEINHYQCDEQLTLNPNAVAFIPS